MDGANLITSKQMARLTFVAQTGVGITMLPAALAKEIGRDGWISVVATGLLAIVLSTFIILLLKRYSDKAIYDINKFLYGKIIGTVLNVVFLMYLIFAAASGISIFSLFIRITLFPATPPIIMTTFVLLPSIYMVYKGLKTVARFKFVTMAGYFITLLYVVLIYKEIHFTFLMPIGEIGVMPILSSMKMSFFAYIGLELVVVFFPHITDREKTLKWHVIANIASMLFMTIIVAVCTGVFGHKFLSEQIVPLFNLSRVFNAPILERVDLYVVAAWMVVMGCSIRAYIMASFSVITKGFNIKKSKPLYLFFIFLLIFISRMPKDLNSALHYLEITNYAGMGICIFLLICLIISLFNKKGVIQHETQN